MSKGREIIRLLEVHGIELKPTVRNTINHLAYEIHQEGFNTGMNRGIGIGIESTCAEIVAEVSKIKCRVGAYQKKAIEES